MNSKFEFWSIEIFNKYDLILNLIWFPMKFNNYDANLEFDQNLNKIQYYFEVWLK